MGGLAVRLSLGAGGCWAARLPACLPAVVRVGYSGPEQGGCHCGGKGAKPALSAACTLPAVQRLVPARVSSRLHL